jgi:hypothetical protein
MQERENDIKAVVEARKELEGHHKTLHEKTLVVLQKFKDELDADLTDRYTKGEQELLDMADEGTLIEICLFSLLIPLKELVARAKFAKQQAELQHEADKNMGKVRNELLAMEEMHKVRRPPFGFTLGR